MRSLLTLAFLITSAATTATDLTQGLQTCRSLTEPTARLACYDALSLTSVATAQTGNAASTSAQTTAPTPIAVQSGAEVEQEFGKRLARPVDDLEQIDSRITSVRFNLHKKALITLENGQIWQQNENVQMRLQDGMACSVKRAALGSFLLKCDGSSKTMRVRRVE